MAEPARGNMRPCGCHHGRPCTCEMGTRGLAVGDFACGECINCQLNARAVQRNRKPVRRCVQYDAGMAEQQFDRLEIAPGCVLRMRKPDWDVQEKSAFYTHMRQLRLGLLVLRLHSATSIERQVSLRKKYNRDLVKTQEVLQRVEDNWKKNLPGSKIHRTTTDVTYVDSDAFDSHSKQLIPAETLLPQLLARLETVNDTIATEEHNLQLVEAYVRDVAVKKLQATARGYQRAQQWKRIWWYARKDAEWAAAVVIQSVFRMVKCKRMLPFLKELKRTKTNHQAADRLRRFFHKVSLAQCMQLTQQRQEAVIKTRARKNRAAAQILLAIAKIICRLAIGKWRDCRDDTTAHDQHKISSAATTIQRHWRGLCERLCYHRTRYRRLLSEPVRALYDRFVCHGDLWRLLFEVDAAFRRHEERELEERQDATTFVSELVRDKRVYEDKMMQAWFTASALESPIVRGAESMASAFHLGGEEPEGFPLAHAMMRSPLAKELVALSPKKIKSDVFPDDLPAEVIRQATYEGFSIAETVAVMRGLIAQGKAADDPKLVLKMLKSRAPLMMRSWKPERVMRCELRPSIESLKAPIKHTSIKRHTRKPASTVSTRSLFLSDNMLDNIPGGLKGSVNRILLVAGLKCFDPDAPHCRGRGAFVFRLESSIDPWRSYLDTSPLLKIRREQVVHDAIQQHVEKLKENHCFTAFDILHIVRGIDELASWGIPRPLVMAIYDVIELLHQQTVNRSERNIKRQIRVSAQFEVYVKRQEKRSERHDNPITPPALNIEVPSREPLDVDADGLALEGVAVAIERDVLDLPLRTAAIPVGEVLFRAHFLLCDSDAQPSTSANQQRQAELSQDNYKRFLSKIVTAQLAGDSDGVKQLVQTRMETASQLALKSEAQLRVASTRDLKVLCERNEISLPEALQSVLRQLLVFIPVDEENSAVNVGRLKSGKRQKGAKSHGRGLAPLSPLIQQSRVAMDTLDDALRGIDIPF